MASTWSALKIELLETGQNSGQWGNLTNVNLGDAVLGEAITGQATVDFATDADVTITLTDSATTQAARNLRLNITESSSGVGSVRNLILGSGCQIEKFYLINNTGTGAKTVKNTSGTGISVPAGKATLVYNNGTNVVDAASYFTSLTLGSALPVASGGTGLTAGTSGGVLAYTASGTLASSAALTQYGVVYGGGAGVAPSATANGTTGQVLTATTSGAPSWASPATSGTVTSVAVSGGTTGLTTSGGPITTSGTITLAGTVATTNGGTGLTSFTSSGVVYASSSSALATGSALQFDGSELRATGIIGSTSANGLRAYSAANTGYRVQINNDGTNGVFSAVGGNDAFFIFNIAGSEGMRLTSTGLGIGTSSPTVKLDILNTNATYSLSQRIFNASAGTFSIGQSPAATFLSVDNFAMAFCTNSNGGVAGTSVPTNERMRIDSSGNLLVGGTAARGTTAGTAHLDLFNGTAPAGTLTNGVSLYSSSGDLKFMNAAGDAFDVGYRNIPQNLQASSYTLTLADAGKLIYRGSGSAATWTIPANSSVAYPIGTAITFINMTATSVSIAITTDTMYLSPAGTTGTRTLALYGSATAIKIASTDWLISGSGLT